MRQTVCLLVVLLSGCGLPVDLLIPPDLTALQVSPMVREIDRRDFERFDDNHDGRLSEHEFAFGLFEQSFGRRPHFWERAQAVKRFSLPFEVLDRNRNGFVEAHEYGL